MKSKENSTTLITLFDNLGKDFTRGVSMIEFSKQCALLANEFAIGFADWLFTKDLNVIPNEYTVKELLEIYKKEKGL